MEKVGEENMNCFSSVSSTPSLWKSRKRSGSFKKAETQTIIDNENIPAELDESLPKEEKNLKTSQEIQEDSPSEGTKQEEENVIDSVLSEKRKALFEPLEPVHNIFGKRLSAESLLPPPDFESASYPKGWLIGKKRKLVNVDVVESMRRIAVQEMNRKDREIDGLSEQLEEDARCLEHLQRQLLDERSKRADVERENSMLQNQITMLMDMIQENEETMDDDDTAQVP